ncbi:carbohydrate kinase family protein [Mangrovicella endophytica]|uniref:carbohydrate kinase family protein n=1 Tax=Mangrovicella endophytica TaxID=2066697 RepID=UPI000C9E0921|nr:carbohydrate kinase family protein [Mangrovicella endophytica]
MNEQSESQFEIVVVGGAHRDTICRTSAPATPGASNPGTSSQRIGGGGFNAALSMSALGGIVHVVGARGGDTAGNEVAVAIARAGMIDAGVVWLDRRTPSYTAVLDCDGELIVGVADMGLYDLLTARALSRKHFRDLAAKADALLVDANLPESGLRHLAALADGRPIAAIGVSPAKAPRLGGILPFLSVAFLSKAEASALLDSLETEAHGRDGALTDVGALAGGLAAVGLKAAVITDGPHDAAILDGGGVYRQSPPAVSPVDVTGAGDTLAGVAFHAILSGESLLSAVQRGQAAAALRITAPASFPPHDFETQIAALVGQMPQPRRIT